MADFARDRFVSQSTPLPPPRIAVVGGGITGLAAAHRLSQLWPGAELRLFEASDRLGGPLHTLHSGELVLEQGADSFLTRDPVVVELCRELGLGDGLLPTSTAHRRALVVCRGRLHPVPEGWVLMQPHNLRALLRTPVLSLRGKLRVLAEPLVGRPVATAHVDHDESVASFATRRLGREAFERLVEPLLAGIYVADAAELSLAATMPEFLAAERNFGTLAGARRAQPLDGRSVATAARYGAFVTLRRGMGALVEALAAQLPADAIQLSRPVARLEREGGDRWRVTKASGASETFNGVLLTAPAKPTAALVAGFDQRFADLLQQIRAASSVVVTLVYRPDQINRKLDGFGFVVPRVEGRPIVAASFPSVKFAERAANQLRPIRVFMGGVLHPDIIDREDASLLATARSELADLIGASGEPLTTHVARWRDAMPQYRVGHLELVAQIERAALVHRGLGIAGASYRGVGIPQCVSSGRKEAERIAAALRGAERRS